MIKETNNIRVRKIIRHIIFPNCWEVWIKTSECWVQIRIKWKSLAVTCIFVGVARRMSIPVTYRPERHVASHTTLGLHLRSFNRLTSPSVYILLREFWIPSEGSFIFIRGFSKIYCFTYFENGQQRSQYKPCWQCSSGQRFASGGDRSCY